MSNRILALVSAAAFIAATSYADALPLAPAPAREPSPLITTVAGGCGPGLVRGRRGTCLKRRAVFGHGRILRKGCGKPIGAGLRTPC